MLEHDIFEPNLEMHSLNKIIYETVEILQMQAEL